MTEASRSYATAPPKLIGGVPCLDFVNTAEWRGDGADQQERLHDYRELLHWAAAAGLVPRGAVRALQAAARARPEDAERVRNDAIALREAVARLVRPGRAQRDDLALLNRLLVQAPARTALAPAGSGFAWAGIDADALRRPLWPVLWSAAELLTGRLDRVHACADPRCGWMFLDTSRTHRRRWCSMEDCGNRAKARRHYERRTEKR